MRQGSSFGVAQDAQAVKQKEIDMRELTLNEVNQVAGGECPAGNSYGGVTEPSSLGQDIIALYEGMVEATSYIIERVANAV